MLRRLRAAASALFGPPPPPTSVYLGDHTALTTLEGRMMMFVDTRANDVTPSLLMRGLWEPEATALFKRLIRPGATVLDIGANQGVYTLLAARAAGPTGQVHAFEPNRRYCGLIQRSLSVNGFMGQASIHNVALGETAGETELVFSWSWGGGAHLAVDSVPVLAEQERLPCRVVAIDEMFADAVFTADVIKMDVEGAEARALRGMWRLLQRSAEVRIMFEFAPGLLDLHGVGAAEMIHLLRELGFRFWEIGEGSRLRDVSAESLASATDGLRNILAARGAPVPG